MKPEAVEFRDGEQLAIWQDFRLSTMPEIISSMHLCHAVFALADSGILDNLRNGKRRPDEGLLEGVVEKIGKDFLEYLVQRGVLDRRTDGFALSRKGELLTSDVALARLGVYLESYGSVVSRLNELLTGKAVYGTDVHRNGGPLGKHSATMFSLFHTPVLVEAMRGRGVARMLDIGCGGGSLLVDACKRDPEFTGIGLDIDADAIEEAKRLARQEGVADRLEFVVGDAFDPQRWPEVCLSADGLCIVSALHELFRDGEQAVIGMLNAYRAMLPEQKILLVGEPEIRYDAKDNDDDFYLVHILTNQGLPRKRAAWLEVFEKTELECRRVYSRPGAGPPVCFYDLAPR